jgi:hypothetical protein
MKAWFMCHMRFLNLFDICGVYLFYFGINAMAVP